MEVLSLIAAGGFGRVERVRLTDGTVAARKTFSPLPTLIVGASLDKLKERFCREARVQSSLPTDMFIAITHAELEADPPWFVMPLADGNLHDAIENNRLTSEQQLEALSHILDALEYLHASGIVHRDLKPSNILRHDGRWKLSDFGLVLLPTSESQRLTTQLSAWGTATYCAPEQWMAFKTSGASVDIYSLGCVLHDMYGRAQRVPYQKYTCAGAAGPVIEKCTDPDPAKRFKTVAALRTALFAALSTPPEEDATPEAKVLAAKLATPDQMGPGDMADLRRLMRAEDAVDVGQPILIALDVDALAKLYSADADVWRQTALRLCEWAHGSFSFEFCDVLVAKLQSVFSLGDPDIKALAVLAAARLGSSHNRYYVMGQVIGMCGRGLDDLVARRIAVEIVAENVHEDFIRCAQRADQGVLVYHRAIRTVLEQHLRRKADEAPAGNIPF